MTHAAGRSPELCIGVPWNCMMQMLGGKITVLQVGPLKPPYPGPVSGGRIGQNGPWWPAWIGPLPAGCPIGGAGRPAGFAPLPTGCPKRPLGNAWASTALNIAAATIAVTIVDLIMKTSNQHQWVG